MPQTEFKLDEHTAQLVAELVNASQQAQIQAAKPFSEQINILLKLAVRSNRLQGEWKLSQDRKSLVREDTSTPNLTQVNKRKKGD